MKNGRNPLPFMAASFIVFFLALFCSTSAHAIDFGFTTNQLATLSDNDLNIFSQNNILFYDPAECESGGGSLGSLTGTKKYEDIGKAKNAEKSVFRVDPNDPFSAKWSANNTAEIKKVLETYGDLAYQTGRAVGVPWIAILVQMHYEDPTSDCGKNNFWGNGCFPGTSKGGASRQGNNLGEGFAQYAATLTNGNHDQAIGIADPKEYLEKLGPTWVQGNINGPGYGSINGMKKHVDALTAYVNSPEGQAITSTFYNWAGVDYGGSSSTSSSDASSSSENTTPNSSVTWDTEGWITSGMDGYKKEAVSDLGTTYKSGKPNKILLHFTQGTTPGLAAYGQSRQDKVAAHFTVDMKNKKLSQHHPLSRPSGAVDDRSDILDIIQIELVGFGFHHGNPDNPDSNSKCIIDSTDYTSSEYCFAHFGDAEWGYLATLLKAISKWASDNGGEIPLTSSAKWTGDVSTLKMSENDFNSAKGIVGHMHIPFNKSGHYDPGNIWPMVQKALGSNIDSSASSCDYGNTTSDGSGDILANVQKIIDLANQNGSDYRFGGGRSIDNFKNVLNNNAPNNIDCTGFASMVYWMTYENEFKSSDIFSSFSLYGGGQSSYVRVDENDVRPGDIFVYTDARGSRSGGHGGIVIEVENGRVTKIAETNKGHGEGVKNPPNKNIGYSSGSKLYNQNTRFFRWKGAN